MAIANVFLKVTIEWDFDEAELCNLFDDATICLPNGENIKNGSMNLPNIDCMAIVIQR